MLLLRFAFVEEFIEETRHGGCGNVTAGRGRMD